MINYANGNPRNIIYEYGRLTIEDIKNHAMTYIGQKTRKAQNYFQMYHCISNSITESAHLNIVAELYKYTLQGTHVGEILFKLLIQKVVIETRSTDYNLRENLTNLETYTTTVNSNIYTFKHHLKVSVGGSK